MGFDPKVLGKIVQSYIRDVAKFTTAFLTEYAKHTANGIAEYKELKQKG